MPLGHDGPLYILTKTPGPLGCLVRSWCAGAAYEFRTQARCICGYLCRSDGIVLAMIQLRVSAKVNKGVAELIR